LEQRAEEFRAAVDERIHFLNMLHIVVDEGLRCLRGDPAAQRRVQRGRYTGKDYSAAEILAEFEPRAYELAEMAHVDLFGAFDLLLEDLFAWAWREYHAGRWPEAGFHAGELNAPDETTLRWNWKRVKPAKRIDRLSEIMRVVPYLFHLDLHATHRVIRNALAHDGGLIKQGALDEACLPRIDVKCDDGATTTYHAGDRVRLSIWEVLDLATALIFIGRVLARQNAARRHP
jgi:hypothetical protein